MGGAIPNSQLDPELPARRKSYIPSRPPPPPPIRIIDMDSNTNISIVPPTPPSAMSRVSPTMEEKTEELLALLATAALSTGSLTIAGGPSRLSCISGQSTPMAGTPHSFDFVVSTPMLPTARPPPRNSVPADISDLADETRDCPLPSATAAVCTFDDLEFGELEWAPDSDDESMPPTPKSASLYSQASMPQPCVSALDLDQIPLEPCTPAGSLFNMSLDGAAAFNAYDIPIPDSPFIRPYDDLCLAELAPKERVLRSRWSSSTLAESFADHRGSRWMSRLTFGSSVKKSPTKATFSLRSPTMPHFNIPKPPFSTPAKKPAAVPSTPVAASPSPATKKSSPRLSSGGRTLGRRDSNASLASTSGESTFSVSSTSSNGLKRKPIPIEIFMRA